MDVYVAILPGGLPDIEIYSTKQKALEAGVAEEQLRAVEVDRDTRPGWLCSVNVRDLKISGPFAVMMGRVTAERTEEITRHGHTSTVISFVSARSAIRKAELELARYKALALDEN